MKYDVYKISFFDQDSLKIVVLGEEKPREKIVEIEKARLGIPDLDVSELVEPRLVANYEEIFEGRGGKQFARQVKQCYEAGNLLRFDIDESDYFLIIEEA